MTALTTQKYLKFLAFLGIACRNQVFVGNPLMTLLTTLNFVTISSSWGLPGEIQLGIKTP